MAEYCEHIYRHMGSSECPVCGMPTHETNWEFIAEQRRLHREEHGLFYNVREWWSI